MDTNIANLFAADVMKPEAPDFVPEEDIDTLRAQVRRIVVPEGVSLKSHRNLSNLYPNLEKVSISIRDYIRFVGYQSIDAELLELRMPEEGKMMQTEAIEKAFTALIPKYAYREIEVLRKDRDTPYHDVVSKINLAYLAYTRASFAWTEDIALTSLLLTGLENGVIGAKDIKPLADAEICRILKEYMDVQRKPLYEIAHFIRNTPLLVQVFAVHQHVDKQLEITGKEELYELIDNELNYDYDLGLTFKGKVEVEGTAMHGFDGYGSLKHCSYSIRGLSTPETNLDIIRLTSKYPQKNPQGASFFKDECDSKVEAGILPTATSHLIPEFEFLAQSWFGEKAVGGLWSFPSGTISHDGIINETSIDTASITTELCYLGQFFKNLTLEITVTVPRRADILSDGTDRIHFALRDGKVTVRFHDYSSAAYPMGDAAEFAQYNRLLCEGKPLLDRQTIAYISAANKLEREQLEKDETKTRLYELLDGNADSFMFGAIRHYMNTRHGWIPSPVLGYSHVHQMMTWLFEMDVDKLDRLMERELLGEEEVEG